MELQDLAGLMATVADSLRAPADVVQAPKLITAAAVETIPGVTHVSISVASRDGIIMTLAPTDAVAATAEDLQRELGEGPSIDATMFEQLVQVDDLDNDPRWELYGPKASALGLRSQLSFPFRADSARLGALSLYADEPDVLDADARSIGAMFAQWAAVLFGSSRHQAEMAQALASRTAVGTAIGILMERYQLDQDRAFAFLARLSQNGNVKLRKVAATIVAETTRKAS